ncbi:MAG: hypothetical protein M0C28_28675 [Candidatus Moduliflexus flocculans]|nr:hypothetical protein [Candidatus Moduliflexus flocculans]
MLETLPLLQLPQTTWMPRLSFAPRNTAPRGDTLVVVFLRGAADTLNMVVPHGEDAYHALRPTLGIARPGRSKKDERRKNGGPGWLFRFSSEHVPPHPGLARRTTSHHPRLRRTRRITQSLQSDGAHGARRG